MMASNGQKETLRKMLRERVPPYLNNKLVHALCEDAIESFGSLYPDRTLNLCMRIAQRLSTDNLVMSVPPKAQVGRPERRRKPSRARAEGSRVAEADVFRQRRSVRHK